MGEKEIEEQQKKRHDKKDGIRNEEREMKILRRKKSGRTTRKETRIRYVTGEES